MKQKLRTLLLTVFGLIFVFSACKAGETLLRARREDAAFAALARQAAARRIAAPALQAPAYFSASLAAQTPPSPYAFLKEQNPDFFGWLSVPGTRLDYPVMYTPDEPERYLRRAFDGSESVSGTPFVGEGYTADGNHTIIYGHNMDDGSMFAALLSYAEQDFWREHPAITLDTLDGGRSYQVLGAFYSQAYPQAETGVFRFYQCGSLRGPQAFADYAAQVQAAALYPTGVRAGPGGKLLTLATCSPHAQNGRFVVVAYSEEE